MPDFSTLGLGQRWLGGVNTGSRGQNVIPSATANTKGVYANLITAANNLQDSVGMLLTLGGVTAQTDYLVDVAIGAASSEQIIVNNLHTMTDDIKPATTYFLPIAIPAGIRVAARAQAGRVSAGNCHVLMTLVAQGALPSSPLQRVTAYGANARSDSGGVSVDPGTGANTKGAWSELTSSTTADCRFLLVGVGHAQGVLGVANWLVDIGVGAAGSEVVILPNLGFVAGTGPAGDTAVGQDAYGALPVQIPAGARIAARAQCSDTASPNRLLDVCVYGVD